ncbi:capsular exopolysaccharide synthesis family protein [Conexibacter arvalis]|uniref:Capsular exopolysaccharide synthesis family protein n=2 Tax=Conexibacter arvalis TaxID=912552 RepID=A0A840IA04_9ACTN|nr:capsular exopolysaccharide synthesis family protein [Conexibacter arvalis]
MAAAIYVTAAPKVYTADAELLVTPVSAGDPATSGLGLLTDSTDPTQVVSTAARLVSSPAVALATRERLGLSESPQELLDDVIVEPVAQSNLLAISARRGDAAEAARLANAYAASAVEVRTEQLHQEVASQLPQLQQQLDAVPPGERTGPGTLGERVSALQALAAAPDPTVRVATRALPPLGPSSPQRKLALGAGLLCGLIVGIGAAFAAQALDPRLRQEDQLRALFRLPILARIPRLRNVQRGPLTPGELTPAAIESYRTLRATLAAALDRRSRSVLITSSSPGEGKTTTAIGFAEALAVSGHRVLLIEGDLRRPSIGEALGIEPTAGIGAVLLNRATIEQAVVTSPEYGDRLGFLLAERTSSSLADRLSLPTARALVAEAEAVADFVVIDSPPLTEVIDALPLAQEVDAVVIMTRIGTSRLNRLRELGELLAQGGVTPAGVVVLGRERSAETVYEAGRDVAGAPA